jgi:hypothetical protein
MILTGTITKELETKQFEGKNGMNTVKEYLVKYGVGQYPQEVVLSAWNDFIDKMDDCIGSLKDFHIEPTSRESKGRYYTSVKVWKVS